MPEHDLVIKIYDLQTDENVDISSIALEKTETINLNTSRSFSVQVPAGHSLMTGLFGDGYPAGIAGDRKLLVWRDDTIIHHERIRTREITGDNSNKKPRLTLTSYDAITELGYEAEERPGRPVRDDTGNFITPSFNSDGPISGPDLLYQILTNSMQTGTESDPNPGEGPLPIDLTLGTFDTSIPPAIDLSPSDSMQWPILIGDFLQLLLGTNVFDFDLRPVDPTEGLDPYIMGSLSALNAVGTDRSGSVHFDFHTGSKNAIGARFTEDDFGRCNKLYDYLGPRVNLNRWAGNITPTAPSPGGSWPTAFTDAIAASRARYGTNMFIREIDSLGTENSDRPLWVAYYKAEQFIRLNPKRLLFITPSPDAEALFEPGDDYNPGDLIAINTGGDFGVDIAATQRIYGWTRTWNRNGNERVSQLRTSADQETS